MRVTFDDSGAEFVLEAFGYHISRFSEDQDAIWIQNTRAQCCKCLKHISIGNLGGIIKYDGYRDGPALICNDEKCLREHFGDKTTEGNKKEKQ